MAADRERIRNELDRLQDQRESRAPSCFLDFAGVMDDMASAVGVDGIGEHLVAVLGPYPNVPGSLLYQRLHDLESESYFLAAVFALPLLTRDIQAQLLAQGHKRASEVVAVLTEIQGLVNRFPDVASDRPNTPERIMLLPGKISRIVTSWNSTCAKCNTERKNACPVALSTLPPVVVEGVPPM
jgi:hypothetical protein